MKEFVYLRSGEVSTKIFLDEILYIKAERKYVKLVTYGKSHLIRGAITTILESFPSGENFCRIHKSYIVAVSHISGFDAKTVFVNDKKLPVGRKFKIDLNKALNIYPLTSAPKTSFSSGTWPALTQLFYVFLQIVPETLLD